MNADEALFRAINGLAGQSATRDWMALALSNAGLLWAPGVLLGLYWLWLSRREALLAAPLLAASIGILDFIGARIKDLVARPRPCMVLSDIHQIEACGKVFGFPSNHAINTATVAAFLQVLYPRSGWVSWPLVFLVGLARVYIGAHYVTDVMAGWLIGGCCGAAIAMMLKRWPRFRKRPQTGAPASAERIPLSS
jgi:membrane-associated phospholipid phosphatase